MLVSLLLAVLPLSCLPEDERAPPAELIVNASGDEAVATGFATDDGWDVRYERFLVSLGHVGLRGTASRDSAPTCTEYSGESTHYLRVLDMQRPVLQKLSTSYAFGECRLAFELWPPSSNAVLGTGVDEGERASMSREMSDPFTEDTGAVAYVRGQASRFGAVIRFEWSFRRLLVYANCGEMALEPGEDLTVNIRFRGRTLFQDRLDEATAAVRFTPFAAADTDADGNVTLEELSVAARPDGDSFPTVGELLYTGLVPRLPRVGDGIQCFEQAIMKPPE
jgi:hypothetical protein